MVVTPTELSSRERELFKELASLEHEQGRHTAKGLFARLKDVVTGSPD
jgi:DnaJ-class molecular chaperone